MKKNALAALVFALAAAPAFAQNVKITPIGSHPGELCANDRAIIFEDPTGVRLLYDPDHNVTDADDPRIGTTPRLSSTATTAAEQVTENIAENIADIRITATAACTLFECGMAVLVVGATLGRVGEHFPGLFRFLELELSILVAIVTIRMMLHRQTAIGLLQIVLRRILGDTQGFVIVTLAHAAGFLFGRRFWYGGKSKPGSLAKSGLPIRFKSTLLTCRP